MYAAFQQDNPEQDFNEELINWREKDDAGGYLEDVFRALEVVPGITFVDVSIEKDESRFPPELCYNDIEFSRLDLARVRFHLELGEDSADVTLSLFLPKLVDSMFYVLNGSLYYPILQLVDRGTYVTRKTLTLKTLLMPLVFRRDEHATLRDLGSGRDVTEAVFTLDLFRSKINVCKYLLASKGLFGAIDFLVGAEGGEAPVRVCTREQAAEAVAADPPGTWRLHAVAGPSGVCVAAEAAWAEALDLPADGSARRDAALYRCGVMATLAEALEGAPRRAVEEDDAAQWRRRLGRHFTQNSNGFEEKADKILVSLERILDERTKKNLSQVPAADKADVYCILRWMMRDFAQLCRVDGMEVRNKRVRVSEYIIHPLLLKFSESTYRLLNSKSPSFKQLLGVFRPFVHDPENGRQRPQTGFLLKKLVTQELLRYVGMVNSFDLLTSLRWCSRGPQSQGERGRGEIALKYRGHHPSYVGRIGLSAASASDPGTSGTLVPFCRTDPGDHQFFL
jgi:hypothetical protein